MYINKVLVTKDITDAISSRDPDGLKVYQQLRGLAKEFEAGVWVKGFQEQNRGMADRGIQQVSPSYFDRLTESETESPRPAPVQMMGYTIAGRTMITLARNGAMFSLIADETSLESTMGIQSIYGTLSQVEEMTRDAIQQWTNNPQIEVCRGVQIAGIGAG
jgi:hypothetical protein